VEGSVVCSTGALHLLQCQMAGATVLSGDCMAMAASPTARSPVPVGLIDVIPALAAKLYFNAFQQLLNQYQGCSAAIGYWY
jgi:hypothetical protein